MRSEIPLHKRSNLNCIRYLRDSGIEPLVISKALFDLLVECAEWIEARDAPDPSWNLFHLHHWATALRERLHKEVTLPGEKPDPSD